MQATSKEYVIDANNNIDETINIIDYYIYKEIHILTNGEPVGYALFDTNNLWRIKWLLRHIKRGQTALATELESRESTDQYRLFE